MFASLDRGNARQEVAGCTSAASFLTGSRPLPVPMARPDGPTLEENVIDLGWHRREFTIGHSFACGVMNDEKMRCHI